MLPFKHQTLLYTVVLSTLVFILVSATPLAVRENNNWILKAFHEGPFSAAEEKVFEPILTGIKLGKKISLLGGNNGGIFSVSEAYKGHASGDLLVKVIPDVWKGSFGEVKALGMKHQLVASGMLTDVQLGPKAKPVIVMVRQPGELLRENEEYKAASKAEQEAMRKQAIKLACEEVAEEVINLQIFHDDNNMDNVLVTVKNKQVVAARIVDYGGESVFHTKKSVSKEVVTAYCENEALQWWK